MRSVIAALALASLFAGCATRLENHPLPAGKSNEERRVIDLQKPERPVILIAISGGGSRAAALGWVVLRELERYRYSNSDDTARPLLDDIAVISSVSGGSVIAASFALDGTRSLDRFESDFLKPDNTKALGAGALNPLRLLTGASQSDLVEELFDRQLFGGKTFAELNRPNKPYLVLNATDMISGQVFGFTPQRFDDICSDLDAQTISSGVAASAAVPLIFTPIAFRNHSVDNCLGRPIPLWVTNRLGGRYAPYLNVDEFKLARYSNDLRRGKDRFRDIEYLYFLDGGLADNLAIHGLLEALSSPYAARIVAPARGGNGSAGTLLQALNEGRIRKVVVVVVNARADPNDDASTRSERPGIFGVINSVVSVPIDSATSSVGAQMDTLLAEFNAAGGGSTSDAVGAAGLKVYHIVVDFDQLRVTDPAQRALRDEAKQIPTLWTITKPNLDTIEKAGTLLLRQHPCFQRLLGDMAISADFVDLAFARMGCRQASDK
jgi:NTE family protein